MQKTFALLGKKNKNPSLKTCCTNQVRDGYIHFDLVLCQVLKWRFEIAHKYVITVTLAILLFLSFSHMIWQVSCISYRIGIVSCHCTLWTLFVLHRDWDIKVYYTCMYYYVVGFHDIQYNYNCHYKWLNVFKKWFWASLIWHSPCPELRVKQEIISVLHTQCQHIISIQYVMLIYHINVSYQHIYIM